MQLGQLDKEYEKFRDNEEDLERWVGLPAGSAISLLH